MRRLILLLVAVFFLGYPAFTEDRFEELELFDLALGKESSLSHVLPELRQKRIILVGELHSEKAHHRAQLMIIQALHNSGLSVVIGMEMFRSDNQNKLNEWVRGTIDEKDFKKIYYENWGFPWPLYGMIFDYAREKRIPIVGLNVTRDITRQVAQGGFQSLSDKQRAELPNVVCEVDPEYMAFIRKAYGAHAHGDMNFTYFCEAQLVWDKVMATRAIDYLNAHPDVLMVLLAGTGHAWKQGIPEQIRQISGLPYAVILPQIPGRIEAGITTSRDTDYIIVDKEK